MVTWLAIHSSLSLGVQTVNIHTHIHMHIMCSHTLMQWL